MIDICLPKLNVNEESCLIAEWLCEDGQEIEKNEVIAVIETSKAAVDLEAEESGIIHRLICEEEECVVGDPIARIFKSELERQQFLCSEKQPTKPSIKTSMIITKKARALIDSSNITGEQLASIGKEIIKVSDVEKLIEGNKSETAITLNRQQLRVAKTVTSSRQTIPWAFLVMKVCCDNLLTLLSNINGESRYDIGLPEYFVKTAGQLRANFPFFFGSLKDEKTFLPSEKANIGVTLDLGKGLFIPVVKDVESLTLIEVAEILADYKHMAFRNTFAEADLTGGNFSVSLNTDEGIVTSVPVIAPSQTCMLSLAAVYQEVILRDNKTVVKNMINLGVAYDHRVINGCDAVSFCNAIKSRIESPEEFHVD